MRLENCPLLTSALPSNSQKTPKYVLQARHYHHHHHHHHADIYNAPITTKQEHRCSTKIQIVVDESY